MNRSGTRRRIFAACALFFAILLAGQILTGQAQADGLKRLPAGLPPEQLLPELYARNPDLAGWIRIPGTSISYPVMHSEAYLQRDFSGEYSRCGTPFVLRAWDPEDSVTMIYGHNMWAEKTMFHPLHEYASSDYLHAHPDAELLVLREDKGNVYVQRRQYQIYAAVKLSIRDDLYIAAENCGIREAEGARELHAAAQAAALWEKQEPAGETEDGFGTEELVLCTCSYHIPGKRDDGRLLVFASRRQ